MNELQKVSDPSQKWKMAMGVVGLVLLALIALNVGGGSGLLGAEFRPDVNSTTSIAQVNTTATLVFVARSQASVRILENFATSGSMYIVFGTSTSIDQSLGGIILKSSTTITMTDENGLLHRGDIYARLSRIVPTSTLRLTQYP